MLVAVGALAVAAPSLAVALGVAVGEATMRQEFCPLSELGVVTTKPRRPTSTWGWVLVTLSW